MDLRIMLALLLTVAAAVVLVITFKFRWKYMVQEKRCTAETTGRVERYSRRSSGSESSGVRAPIVSYSVDGVNYRVTGPEYMRIKTTHVVMPAGNPPILEEKDDALFIKKSANSLLTYTRNPMEQLYPIGSEVSVFYCPEKPKLAFVKRYCDKKVSFVIGIIGAAAMIAADIWVLFFM